ncbi:MAG TPA: helix-turn-helix domain-containing protein [Oscillatoriaceae cyanobacterium M33_DOE_052]|uniref:Helix-turn-helix domain-containing protein n=1 Tax=Planktothricoides sp. SpSt-374 TaxID=2282167 RepID=A0A7C3ZTE2_9CYAN|nr:helix-turn-helix domain-containing protein [Oscillatoriaceae cyanobacterium M33_DOE_052]
MPKRITIKTHISLSELESRYRKAKDPVERSHYQIIWLLARLYPTEEVAVVTGYCRDWIRRLARRYNRNGPESLADRRHENPGAQPLLDDVQVAELARALSGPAPDGGSWNSRKVAQWISARLRRPVSIQRGWDYLQMLSVVIGHLSLVICPLSLVTCPLSFD